MTFSIAPVQFPKDSPALEQTGNFTRYWFLFLNSISQTIARIIAGQMQQSTQAGLVALAAKLTASDAGLLVEVTDYAHVLRWTGSAWEWGPGEQGSGYLQLFEVDPTGAGWHLYDGTAGVKYLKSDGTTGTVTLPDLTGGEYLKTGAVNSGPNPATAPTMGGGTVASAATGITASTTASGSFVTLPSGAGAASNVSLSGHTHGVTITDPHHTHSLSGVTAGTDGEPANLVRRPYFRQ